MAASVSISLLAGFATCAPVARTLEFAHFHLIAS
jgi:hypothetical protein